MSSVGSGGTGGIEVSGGLAGDLPGTEAKDSFDFEKEDRCRGNQA